MNVLDGARTPRVMPLREVLRAWLDHRQEVLVRRSRHRLAAIERRIEILDGYLAVFLNLDEVIRIIREEDEAKPALMKRFDLSDVQAEAILNMRLRSLRRLEEIELRKEHKALTKEGRICARCWIARSSAGRRSLRNWRRRARPSAAARWETGEQRSARRPRSSRLMSRRSSSARRSP